MLRVCYQRASRAPRQHVVMLHHLADDPSKPYDQAKIERLVPDYDDIRENNDVQHTVTDVSEAGELKDEIKDGGGAAAASALAGDVAGAGRIACEIAAGGVQGVGKVTAAVGAVIVSIRNTTPIRRPTAWPTWPPAPSDRDP